MKILGPGKGGAGLHGWDGSESWELVHEFHLSSIVQGKYA